jgi:hypothetical protein
MTTTLALSPDGRRFSAVANGSGEVDASTVFSYQEDGDLVWARYEGGGVRLGFLVGTSVVEELRWRQARPARPVVFTGTGSTS